MRTYTKSISDVVRPLPVATPFIEGESLTSWILRASFNQGCDYSALLFFYWSEYKLLHADFDKGFNHTDPKIHEDIAILMNSTKAFVDAQTLVNYNQKLDIKVQENSKLKWVIPIVKFNSKKTTGHPYCFLCFKEGKTHLQQRWRYSWYVYCDEHELLLYDTCTVCCMPYQPHLIKIPQNSLSECPHCHADLITTKANQALKTGAFEFQKQAQQALSTGKVKFFDKEWSAGDWFELMLFFINLIRAGLSSKEGNIRRRILDALKLDIRGIKLTKVKTGFAFDFLTIHERVMLMAYANALCKVNANRWVEILKNNGATQATMKLGKKPVIPKAFLSVYEQLPKPKFKPQNWDGFERKLKPKSTKAVLIAWERLQIKIDKVNTHGDIKKNRNAKD